MLKQKHVTTITSARTLTYSEIGEIVCEFSAPGILTLPAPVTGLWYRVTNAGIESVEISYESVTLATLAEEESALFLISNGLWRTSKSSGSGGTVPENVPIIANGTTVTVGPGGNYASIIEAVNYLIKQHPGERTSTHTIVLLAGYIMTEQFSTNRDLSWITIRADVGLEDTYFDVRRSAMTNIINFRYHISSPAFYADGGKLPTIYANFQFDETVSPVGNGSEDMYVVANGSNATIYGKIKGTAGGLGIYAFASSATYHGTKIEYCGGGAVKADRNSSITLRNTTYNQDGLLIDNCMHGLWAMSSSSISAIYVTVQNCTGFAVMAYAGSTIDVESLYAYNCGGPGLVAELSSAISANSAEIEACGATYSGVQNDGAAISVFGSSSVDIYWGNVHDCAGDGIYVDSSSFNITFGSVWTITGDAFWLYDGANVMARLITVDEVGGSGIDMQDGSSMDFCASELYDIGDIAVKMADGCFLNMVEGSIVLVAATAVWMEKGCRLNLQRGGIHDITGDGIVAYDSCEVNFSDGMMSNISNKSLVARRSSTIEACGVSFQSPLGGDILTADGHSSINAGKYFDFDPGWPQVYLDPVSVTYDYGCWGECASGSLVAYARDGSNINLQAFGLDNFTGLALKAETLSNIIATEWEKMNCGTLTYDITGKSKLLMEGWANEDEISDTAVATATTWSSYKINELLSNIESDVHFAYTQETPAQVWTITHNLGKYPSVNVVDSAGTHVYGEVQHTSSNQLVLTFSAAFSGKAYLN